MRRSFLVFISISFILLLCSCGSNGGNKEPIKTEVMDFDIQTATDLIKKGEKIITDIAIKDTVTRQEYNQFLLGMDEAYNGYEDAKWEYMFFFNNEFDDEQVETLHLNKNMFYPTMYHENVEIVSAQVKNTYYQDESFNENILIIREEYSGQDSKLEGWYREYLYRKNDEDNWVFYSFGGQMNFSGEGFTSDYLRMKH